MRASVVIPLFNKAPYIRRCLDSVAGQSAPDFEAIIVDDGSTDGGGDAIAALNDPRFRLLRQERAGESAARNRGLGEARAPWVAFLDADDEWRPGFLEATLEVATKETDLVAVFTNVLDAGTGRPVLARARSGIVQDYPALVLEERVGMTAMATLARRDSLLSCGAFCAGRTPNEVGEDQDAFARLAWSGRVAYVASPLAVYHSEVPHGSTFRARTGRPDMPPRVLSYREWSRNGAIPSDVRASSAALNEHLLLDHAAALINFGCRQEAREVLGFECGRAARRTWRYWTLVARTWLPPSAQARLRSLMGRETRFGESSIGVG